MTNTEQRIKMTITWCKNHDFPCKVVGNTVYWQTMIQTAECNEEKQTITWHGRDYFDEIEGEVK